MANIAIVGLGFMGQTHFRNYQNMEGAKVVGFCDIDPKRAAGDFSGTWGNLDTAATSTRPQGIWGVQDYRQLFDRADVDVIDVCVPTPVHAEVAVAALKSGKHVLCEKPLARTLEDAKRIASAAAQARGMFMPAMCIRFWPQWAWLKQAVADRRFGNVLAATFTRLATPPPGWYQEGAKSGGAILDLHIHDTDFVNYLFGPPVSVFSRGYARTSGEIDHIVTQYLYNDERIIVAEGGWAMDPGFPFRMRYTVKFEKATVDYDLARTDSLLVCRDGKAEPIACAATDGWFEELKYFIGCVNAQKKPSIVTADDAVRSVQVIDAERKSIVQKQIVNI